MKEGYTNERASKKTKMLHFLRSIDGRRIQSQNSYRRNRKMESDILRILLSRLQYEDVVMTTFMLTVPYGKIYAGKQWMEFFKAFDIHKYVFALEHGTKTGYKHWQVRFRVSDSKATSMFNYLKTIIPEAHIEKSTNWTDYERKEGWFHDSRDNQTIIRQRFAPLKNWQKEAVYELRDQNNREVDVWYSKEGSKGKSHLCAHLYEHGAVYVCPEDDHIARTVCSALKNKENPEIIVIDIPRNSKWKEGMYRDLEHLKDGLIQDSRYATETRNISGTKVLVVTNSRPTPGKLSLDRWRIHEVP